MLFERGGKHMPTRAIGHEIKVACARWVNRRFKSGAPRVGDGRGREPLVQVQVVRRVDQLECGEVERWVLLVSELD